MVATTRFPLARANSKRAMRPRRTWISVFWKESGALWRELNKRSAGDYPNCVTGWLKRLSWIEIGILVIAVALRIALLDIKPAHFDEGVNGWFADQMERTGYFRYDPTNYHGPLHFYALFLSQTLFGRNLWALRLPAILASVLAVWAALCFREHFGATTARIAALAMAVSPAYVFYGRYSIHESWLVLFSLVFCWGLLGLWTKGERRFLLMLFAGATAPAWASMPTSARHAFRTPPAPGGTARPNS